eukprot:NODE_253_length_11722_cov_0.375118.p3 type:complete len:319 gc:universal NODE_253_length_11722_cov_0.375118:10693-9737(-)
MTELTEQTNFSLPCIGNALKCHKNQFIAGTCSIKERNSISLLTLNDHFSVQSEQIEVDVSIIQCNMYKDLFMYTYYDKNQFGLRITNHDNYSVNLEHIVLNHDLLAVKKTPTTNNTPNDAQLGYLDANTWQFTPTSFFKQIQTICKSNKYDLIASGSTICMVDPLSKSKIEFNQHQGQVLSLDVNSNVSHYFASGGMDRCCLVWDIRNPSTAVMELHDHTHWVMNCKYNPSYDQLIMTTGADGAVILYDLAQYSSKQVMDQENLLENSLIAKWDNIHEPSITGCCWSEMDPWTFGVLSETQIAFGRVPQDVRYHILTA